MKSNSSFKMNKETKRFAATFTDKNKRSQFINNMVEAQLVEENAKRQPLKIKDKE